MNNLTRLTVVLAAVVALCVAATISPAAMAASAAPSSSAPRVAGADVPPGSTTVSSQPVSVGSTTQYVDVQCPGDSYIWGWWYSSDSTSFRPLYTVTPGVYVNPQLIGLSGSTPPNSGGYSVDDNITLDMTSINGDPVTATASITCVPSADSAPFPYDLTSSSYDIGGRDKSGPHDGSCADNSHVNMQTSTPLSTTPALDIHGNSIGVSGAVGQNDQYKADPTGTIEYFQGLAVTLRNSNIVSKTGYFVWRCVPDAPLEAYDLQSTPAAPPRTAAPVIGVAATGIGYVRATDRGNVYATNTPWYGSLAARKISSRVVGIAADPHTHGYWLATEAGKVYAFNAPRYRSRARRPTAPVTGIAATNTGYLLTTVAGNVYSYHTAWHGSVASTHTALTAPVIGISADPRTQGYRLTTTAGKVYAFDAPLYGSTAAKKLRAPVVGITTTTSGGYLLATTKGNVYAFHTHSYRSTATTHRPAFISGIAADPATNGYWLSALDRRVYRFNVPRSNR